MSDEAAPKATNQETAPASKDEESSNKKFDIRDQGLSDIDNQELAVMIAEGIGQLTDKVEQQSQRITELEKKLEESEVSIKKKNAKVLERYEESRRKRLIAKAFHAGNSGVERQDVERIFDVGEDQARNIMKKAAHEYDIFEYDYPGGPISGKLYHIIGKTAEDIADLYGLTEDDCDEMQSRKGRILDAFEWDGKKKDISLLPDLKSHKQELQDERSQEKRRKDAKKKFGALF